MRPTLARQLADPEAIEASTRRLVLLYSVMFGFGGIPLIYMGDEVALDNDTSYADLEAHADDSRWMHRPAMPWPIVERRNSTGTVEHAVFTAFTELVAARRDNPATSAGGQTWIHQLADPAVLAWARMHPRLGRFYGVANFADRPASAPLEAFGWAGLTQPRQVYGAAPRITSKELVLPPYGVAWFVDDIDGEVQPGVCAVSG